MCWSYNRQFGTKYSAVMPASLFGSGDNYDLVTSHVVPALLRKFHTGKLKNSSSVPVWGTGKAYRELLRRAEETKAELIVLGTGGGYANAFGSTSDHVVREAACPVLTVNARSPQ